MAVEERRAQEFIRPGPSGSGLFHLLLEYLAGEGRAGLRQRAPIPGRLTYVVRLSCGTRVQDCLRTDDEGGVGNAERRRFLADAVEQ